MGCLEASRVKTVASDAIIEEPEMDPERALFGGNGTVRWEHLGKC